MSTERELTLDDVLQYAGQEAIRPLAERLGPPPGAQYRSETGGGCGSGSCGCGGHEERGPKTAPVTTDREPAGHTLLDRKLDRRGALGAMFGALAAGSQALSACSPASLASAAGAGSQASRVGRVLQGEFPPHVG
jgi:hypothetical protein